MIYIFPSKSSKAAWHPAWVRNDYFLTLMDARQPPGQRCRHTYAYEATMTC